MYNKFLFQVTKFPFQWNQMELSNIETILKCAKFVV